jgi:hypothetical protein
MAVSLKKSGGTGAPGADGKTVRNGVGAPSNGLGVDGDFYIDTQADTIYGPKTSGAWGSPTSLVGPPGDQGVPGDPGADGKTVRNGSGAPSNGLGVDGDFYIDTSADTIYGPKSAGAWGSPTSLIGPQGNPGTPGQGVLTGGLTGQVLKKSSNADYDTEWENESGGVDLVSYTQFGGF